MIIISAGFFSFSTRQWGLLMTSFLSFKACLLFSSKLACEFYSNYFSCAGKKTKKKLKLNDQHKLKLLFVFQSLSHPKQRMNKLTALMARFSTFHCFQKTQVTLRKWIPSFLFTILINFSLSKKSHKKLVLHNPSTTTPR